VVVGVAVTLAPVVAERPAAGDQVNDVAVPLTVRPVETPLQIVTPELGVTVGSAFTVTVTVAVLLQVPSLPVTV